MPLTFSPLLSTPDRQPMRMLSTRESIEKGEISLLAIVETLLAVTVLIGTTYWFDTVQWLAGACAIAPLLLLRTHNSDEWIRMWASWLGRHQFVQYAVTSITLFATTFIIAFFGTHGSESQPDLRMNTAEGWLCVYFESCTVLLIFYIPTVLFSVRHPCASLIAIPVNWRRIVLATDSHSSPELIPDPSGDLGSQYRCFGPTNDVGWKKWFLLALCLILYPMIAAFRWSVKATCLIYLPLVWLVNNAKFTPELSMRDTLEDFRVDDIQWVRRVLAFVAIGALGLKVTLLWYLTDVVPWVKTNSPSWLLKIMKDWSHLIVPHEIPLWQIAPAVNGILAVGLWVYTRKMLRRKDLAVEENSILAVWRTFTTLITFLSLYTIVCTLLIIWKAGHLPETLQRLWDMTGKQLLP